MRVTSLLLGLVAASVVSFCWAQEVTGSREGRVLDSGGGEGRDHRP